MRKILVLAALIGGQSAAQVDVNQPLNWAAIFSEKFMQTAILWQPLTEASRKDVNPFDVVKAASGKLSGAFGSSMGINEQRLYQSVTFWKGCRFLGSAVSEADYIHSILKRIGYRPVSSDYVSGFSDKKAKNDMIEVWKPLDNRLPSVALSLNLKCGSEDDIASLSVFQIGELRHIAYGKVIADQYFGSQATVSNDTRIQIRTPKGTVRPNEDGRVLVELYNTTPQSLSVILRIDVRDKSGRIINSYSDAPSVEVKGNSPKQVVVMVAGVGAYDAVISIESIR